MKRSQEVRTIWRVLYCLWCLARMRTMTRLADCVRTIQLNLSTLWFIWKRRGECANRSDSGSGKRPVSADYLTFSFCLWCLIYKQSVGRLCDFVRAELQRQVTRFMRWKTRGHCAWILFAGNEKWLSSADWVMCLTLCVPFAWREVELQKSWLRREWAAEVWDRLYNVETQRRVCAKACCGRRW